MNYKKHVELTFNEWKEKGYCAEARSLNNKIGSEYFDTSNPHFFTGNTNSKLVLVHLNPKRNSSDWNAKCRFNDFNDFWHHYEKFGEINYGAKVEKKQKSPFDLKQIRFLRSFEFLNLDCSDKYQNLENVMDRKLQLELVPFGSPNFSYQEIGIENLKPFIDKLLSIINETPREYVIFCGRIFEYVLSDQIKSKTIHTFKLKKKNGQETKSDFQVINIKIGEGENEIIACIAPQFAKQGYPVEEYGTKIRELYGKFS